VDAAQSSGAGPSVCPFVALAEDRDRRADAPDERNRCYAERAPRQRDLVYQSDYCYSARFSSCSVFLSWAARNAAEPAYVSDAATRAWGRGIAAPERHADETMDAEVAGPAGLGSRGSVPDAAAPLPTPEAGLFGLPDRADGSVRPASEALDWVSASAWADAPWDEQAEAAAEELESIADAELDGTLDEESEDEPGEEATTAPRVPAALPLRRRRRPQQPIRSRGSGEWFYADPRDREPLVKRRFGVAPPVLLGVLGFLVVAIVVFLLPTLLSGGDDQRSAAAASPSPDGAPRTVATPPAVAATSAASAAPSPEGSPRTRFYRVRSGDSLSGIAARFGVRLQHLQCLNGIRNRNLISIDQRLQLPPDGYACTPGWRNATPAPVDAAETDEAAEAVPGADSEETPASEPIEVAE